MMPITKESAEILISRMEPEILLKSDLEYARYFIKLMEPFITFSINTNCNKFRYPPAVATLAPHLHISNKRGKYLFPSHFIYFLQIEIYEILEGLNKWASGIATTGAWVCPAWGRKCKCSYCITRLGGGIRENSNIIRLLGEFRYKFNELDDIYKFMSVIELYLDSLLYIQK